MKINEALAILGLDAKASEEDIKKQYRRLVKAGNHPDHCSTYFEKAKATKKFQELTEAKDILLKYLQHFSFEDSPISSQYEDFEKPNETKRNETENKNKYCKSPREELLRL